MIKIAVQKCESVPPDTRIDIDAQHLSAVTLDSAENVDHLSTRTAEKTNSQRATTKLIS
jgi:hypothetical protein